jgi:tetratricopeptide (TPR) repeat protein
VPGRPEAWEPEVWIDEGPVRTAAAEAVARGERTTIGPTGAAGRARPRKQLPDDVADELERVAGPRRAPRLAERLAKAREAFERDRYQDARRILAPLATEAPGAAAVRELYGLTLYRLDRWKQAAVELEAYRALTGSVDQLPVLADCYRALRKYGKVDELWEELRAASPSAAAVAEGRIVAAGALADRGDLRGAIALMERADAVPRRLRDHHLRLWYVLADLYDRSGDVPRARALFRRVRDHAPGFADVEERLANLGS